MKQLASHNYKLEEIPELRAYNAKTFKVNGTKERITLGSFGYKRKDWYGQLLTEFHVKPIHYIGLDKKWHDLDEIASYFGNKNGMVLKEGWEDKVNFGYLAWYLKRQKLINGKGIRIGIPQYPFKRLELPLLLNTVTDFFPDPDPETTTVDGRVFNSQASWDAARDATGGSGSADSAASNNIGTSNDGGAAKSCIRGFFLFDTASIPDGDAINSANLSFVASAKSNDDNDGNDYFVVTNTNPASNTALGTADFDQVRGTDTNLPLGVDVAMQAQSATIDLGSFTADSSTYNDFALNATGLTRILVTGVSKFGLAEGHDVLDDPLAGTTGGNSATIILAETAGTSTDPKLTVNHGTAAATVTSRRLLMLGMG